MKNIIVTSKQLNEVKQRLIEEKQLDNLTLPNFIINSVRQNKTSLGDHPSFPPGDEKRFEEKILLKRFNEVGRAVAKIQGLEQYDKKYLIDKLTEYISKAITIEKEIRSELEEICYNYVCNQFDLIPGDLNIRCELKDKITPENEPNIEPQLLDETEFEDTDSMDSLGKEIYKRRLINSIVQGAAVRLSEDYGSILNDIYKLNPALPELYYNIIALNDYLSFVKETKPSNYNLGGFVSVDLSSEEPVIYSEAVIFPVLVFETVKGIMELVSSHGLPENKLDAEYVIGKADFMLAENWDKRFGVGLYDLFTKNIQNKKLQTEIFNEIIDLPPAIFFNKMKEIFAGTRKGKMYINSLEKYVEREKGFGDIDAAIGKDSEGFDTFTLGSSGNDNDFYFEAEDFNIGEDDGSISAVVPDSSFLEILNKKYINEQKNVSKKKSRLITESKFSGKTIINVDIQPEYENYIIFDLNKWVNFLNHNATLNNIIFLYNGHDTLGMVSEGDYKMWLIDLGIDEDVIRNSTFYDKGYAFFRYCMDNSIDENNIVDLIKYMIRHDINDTRDIDTEMWYNYMQETNHSQQDVRDLLENTDDMINIPDLMDFLNNYSNIILLGGGINECLKEVEIALLSLDKSYKTLSEFVY